MTQRRALKVTLVAAAIGIGLAVGRRLVWPAPPADPAELVPRRRARGL